MNLLEQLRQLYSAEQIAAMEKVRDSLLDDPKALDTHSREVRVKSEKEKQS